MTAYFEPTPPFAADPAALFTECIESGCHALLLDEAAIPPEFFDLSSGIAGELLHKLGLYRIPLACVVPDPSQHPARFQEFLREANSGNQYRFFTTRNDAIVWLESM